MTRCYGFSVKLEKCIEFFKGNERPGHLCPVNSVVVAGYLLSRVVVLLLLLQAQRTVQPLFEEPEEEESITSGALVAPVKKKPHPQTAVPSSGKPAAQKKPRVKGKQPLQGLGE